MQILSIKITSDGTNDPAIFEFKNDFGSMTWARTGVGEYTGIAAIGGFINDYPPRWYLSNSTGCKYAVAQVNQTQVVVNAYDENGNNADNMTGNLVEVIIY